MPTVLSSALRAGDPVHRHELVVPGATDPVTVAAALRGTERIMLVRKGLDTGRTSVIAAGEIAVCGRAGPREAGDGPDTLAVAVDHLAALEFAGDTAADERSWFGFVGYDAVRDFERLGPARNPTLPAYDLFLPEVLVRVGPSGATVIGRGASAAAAREAARRAERAVRRPARVAVAEPVAGVGGFTTGFDEYAGSVRRAKQHILDGDIFQVVLSNRYEAEGSADGLALYRALTALNPSPYEFWYRGPEFEAVGASPEPCVTLDDGRVLIRPLAGTRPRGRDAGADRRAEYSLLASEKELAEHRMLVDLARNDLGRVCLPGTVRVPRLMAVERYSHVMHLTSDVVGTLRAGGRTDDLIRATFPAGTMTGAPKVRAMEIIDDLEPVGRELYSGAVGSFGTDSVDLYLTIRSIVLHHGRVRLQAGGGIVHDSDPAAEWDECIAKLRAGARVTGFDLEGVRS